MELHQFFLTLAVLLLAARFLSEASARVGIPSVIGELAAGLIIGPSLLGWVTPDATLKVLAEIGIILLLFEVGMDTDVLRLARAGAKPFTVALAGIALPLGLGFLCVRPFPAGEPLCRRHACRHQHRHHRAGAHGPGAAFIGRSADRDRRGGAG